MRISKKRKIEYNYTLGRLKKGDIVALSSMDGENNNEYLIVAEEDSYPCIFDKRDIYVVQLATGILEYHPSDEKCRVLDAELKINET